MQKEKKHQNSRLTQTKDSHLTLLFVRVVVSALSLQNHVFFVSVSRFASKVSVKVSVCAAVTLIKTKPRILFKHWFIDTVQLLWLIISIGQLWSKDKKTTTRKSKSIRIQPIFNLTINCIILSGSKKVDICILKNLLKKRKKINW